MYSFSFFFFISCLITSSSVQKISQSINVFSFKRNCPEIWKIIQDNKIAPYTVECQNVSETVKITEETVLQFACSLSKQILLYLCEKNVSINNEQLTADLDKANFICPFDFKGLKSIGNLNVSVWEKELTNANHCNKVCVDIYEMKTQCIILSKINNLMNNFASHAFEEKSQVTVKEPEIEPTYHKDTLSNVRQSHELATSGVLEALKVNQSVPISKISNQKDSYTRQSQELLSLGIAESVKVKQNETPVIDKVTVKTTQQAISKVETTKSIQQTEKALTVKEKPAISLSNEQKFKSTKQPFVKTTKNEQNIDNEETKTFSENQLNVDYVSEDINQVDDVASNQEFFKTQNEVNNKIYAGKGFFQAEESYFFFYFLMFSSLIIFGYLAFHNKNKILAYALEGSSGRRIRRRPNPARYRKLESNLEEAMTSDVSQAAESSVVY